MKFVNLDIDLSNKKTVDHGVLQGNVSGHLIFLLSVQLSEKLEDENDVVQFADETSFYANLKTMKILHKKLKR